MPERIYKILSEAADAQMRADGQLTPSGVDLADGYVHFSTAMQLGDTLDTHYAGHAALVILAVDSAACGAALTWESARGGDLFPHLYADFTVDMVADRFALNAARDGLDGFLKAAETGGAS